MSNYLSQDEIDKLLNGLGGDEEAAAGGGNERHTVLTPIFELFCKHAGSVLTTVATKNVDLASEGCTQADFGAVKEKLGADILAISLPLVSGIEGDLYLIMRKNDAATLANLMMMVDEAATYDAAEHDDAISELLNQVMGAFTTALGAELGGSVSAGNAAVAPFDINNPPFDSGSADMGLAKLTVEGMINAYAALLIPNACGDEIIDMKNPKSSGPSMDMGIGISQNEMNDLMDMAANQSFSAGSAGGGFGGGGYDSYAPPPPPPPRASSGVHDGNIDLLLDVELEINIELGKSELSIKRILELAPGSIVELDKMAGEPVDLIVNNKVVAKGEVVVVDENFGIRIVSLVSAEDRIKSLK